MVQSSALCNCQILSIPLVGSCSISLSRSFSLSFFHSTISLTPSVSLWLSIYCRIPQPSQPVFERLLSCCFLSSSPLSHPFVSQFPFPPGSCCSSVRGVQESKKDRKKERFEGVGEEGRKKGRKESKERKRRGMGEKERNQKHKNRKEAKESDEERKDKRKSLCFLQAFLPSFLPFSSLPLVALLSGKTFCKHKREKKNRQKNHNKNNDSGSRPPSLSQTGGKKNRETTAATNKRSAPEDMQSARFRHHRQREREEKRKERAPRSARKHDHYAALWWTITRMGGGFHHYAQHRFHHYA